MLVGPEIPAPPPPPLPPSGFVAVTSLAQDQKLPTGVSLNNVKEFLLRKAQGRMKKIGTECIIRVYAPVV